MKTSPGMQVMKVIVVFKYNLFKWRNQHLITQAINCLSLLINSLPQW